MKTIHTEHAPAAIGPYSQAIVSGGFVFTSGQIPVDPKSGEIAGADVTAQAEQVMVNLGAVLEAAVRTEAQRSGGLFDRLNRDPPDAPCGVADWEAAS